MKETLVLLREHGVKAAAWTEDGQLLSVEFFPSEPAPLELPEERQASPLESAYMQAANAVRGVRVPDGS